MPGFENLVETIHPGEKTIDILQITAPGRKIQQAHIDQKLYDSVPGIIFLGFYDIYIPEKSGPFLETINHRIRILPEAIKKETKQLGIAVTDDGSDQVLLKIKTDQSWFAQKFTVLLDTGN